MSAMRILPNNLKRQYDLYSDEYKAKAIEILDSGWYVLGKEVEAFEEEWAEYIGTKHCVGVASGLDSLIMAFRILEIGETDEVIVCSNAYIACIMGITINGATPIFVEPDEYLNIDAEKIEQVITPNTKAILAVHLFGQCCDMNAIMKIAHRHNLKVVEDCAQAQGNTFNRAKAGTFGDISCFSFYPSKGCGAFGDAGALCTNNSSYDRLARIIRNYGSEKRYENQLIGMNSRLDELQAGLLRVKLQHLDEMNNERNTLAARYDLGLSNPNIIKPKVRPKCTSSWHQYVVRCEERDLLQQYLSDHGIGSLIHYPIPPHLSEAYSYLGHKQGDFPVAERLASEVLSLPLYNGMTEQEQDMVINTINSFKAG